MLEENQKKSGIEPTKRNASVSFAIRTRVFMVITRGCLPLNSGRILEMARWLNRHNVLKTKNECCAWAMPDEGIRFLENTMFFTLNY